MLYNSTFGIGGGYMAQFLLDFQAFFTVILTSIGEFFAWLSTTVIGEIILFILVMYIFIFVIKLIISLKD